MKCSFCGQYVESAGPFCPYCGRVLKTETYENPANPPAQPPPLPPTTTPDWATPKEPAGLQLWARYFVHGALFSLLITFGAVLWVIISIPLVLCGAFIGLAIALFLLVMLYGYVNTFLNEWIWGKTMQHKWSTVFVHGLVLILVVLAVSIPSFIMQVVLPNPLVAIGLFLIYCFVDGIIGKWMGEMWATTPRRPSTSYYARY